LVFAVLAGLAESALLGALPAWRARRADLMEILRAGGRTACRRTAGRLRSAVIVGEVALSFALAAGAGLMFHSFLELRRIDPGYDPHGLLTFLAVGDAQGIQQPQRRMAFLRELGDRLRAIPGVRSAGASVSLPLHDGGPPRGIRWSTERVPPDPARTADLPTVLPGYFETLRAPVLEGRTFTEGDNAGRRNLAVIDESLARKAFPNQAAVGRRICVYIPDPAWLEVIGVVRRQRLHSLADPGLDQIFMTDGFWGVGVSRHWALRTTGDPGRYAAAVRTEVAKFAPGRLAVTEMQPMDEAVEQAQSATRFQLLLIGVFAAVAAILAAVGLYGVLSSAVRQRTGEIGIRMALGASPAEVVRLVAGQGAPLSAAGAALGLVCAGGLTRLMAGMLVGVAPDDPATLAGTGMLFLLIAAAACWAPARRAARLDPSEALREE
ncbi:MAG: ABC transporter permease, partial [Acidobacteriia bacterium]|nr:ABC transporter permease [Terriglobia bacterium]